MENSDYSGGACRGVRGRVVGFRRNRRRSSPPKAARTSRSGAEASPSGESNFAEDGAGRKGVKGQGGAGRWRDDGSERDRRSFRALFMDRVHAVSAEWLDHRTHQEQLQSYRRPQTVALASRQVRPGALGLELGLPASGSAKLKYWLSRPARRRKSRGLSGSGRCRRGLSTPSSGRAAVQACSMSEGVAVEWCSLIG